MPKKSTAEIKTRDPSMPFGKPVQKTERSHEENQERAYIAASRRADRSIEARVQSARMASEIHKKRTGKAFRISEEIVVNEEMYEEEEDDFPRSYRLLGPHMQTSSHEMNSRVEAYLTNRVAMSNMLMGTDAEWKSNDINTRFAEMFPNARKQARQLSQGYIGSSSQQQRGSDNQMPQSPLSPSYQQSPDYQQAMSPQERSASFSAASNSAPMSPHQAMSSPKPADTTPGSSFVPFGSNSGMGAFAPGESSVFTAELPNEAKMLMGAMDMNGSFGQPIYEQSWANTDQYFDLPAQPQPNKVEEYGQDMPSDVYGADHMSPMPWDHSNPMDDSWDTFINDTPWANDPEYN